MRCLIAVLVALGLAGCTGGNQQVEETPAPDTAAAAEADGTGTVELPGDVILTTRLHLRSDEVNPTSSGALRRRVVYELLEVGPGDAYGAIAGDFERAGFAASKRKKRKDGGFTVAFRKKGAQAVNVLFYPQVEAPSNAEAKSMIAIGWNIAEASP